MSVLIKGISIPDRPISIKILPNETAIVYDDEPHETDCLEIKPHGDLIDRDAMLEDLDHDVEMDERALDDTDIVGIERTYLQFDKDCKQNCMYYLTEQEAVIPAERSEE